MATLSTMQNGAVAKIAELLEDIHAMVRLEEQSQEMLKLPVEQLLDGAPDSLKQLEDRKTRLMRTVDRHAIELFEWRRQSQPGRETASQLDEAQGRLMLAMRALQRLHQDNERILRLRLTLLGEEMRNVERSRQFLRTTLQSVAV